MTTTHSQLIYLKCIYDVPLLKYNVFRCRHVANSLSRIFENFGYSKYEIIFTVRGVQSFPLRGYAKPKVKLEAAYLQRWKSLILCNFGDAEYRKSKAVSSHMWTSNLLGGHLFSTFICIVALCCPWASKVQPSNKQLTYRFSSKMTKILFVYSSSHTPRSGLHMFVISTVTDSIYKSINIIYLTLKKLKKKCHLLLGIMLCNNVLH